MNLETPLFKGRLSEAKKSNHKTSNHYIKTSKYLKDIDYIILTIKMTSRLFVAWKEACSTGRVNKRILSEHHSLFSVTNK